VRGIFSPRRGPPAPLEGSYERGVGPGRYCPKIADRQIAVLLNPGGRVKIKYYAPPLCLFGHIRYKHMHVAVKVKVKVKVKVHMHICQEYK
jgi:hypothetical protein